jgi:hypothetical protein
LDGSRTRPAGPNVFSQLFGFLPLLLFLGVWIWPMVYFGLAWGASRAQRTMGGGPRTAA